MLPQSNTRSSVLDPVSPTIRTSADKERTENSVAVPPILPPKGAYSRWGWRAFNGLLVAASLPVGVCIGIPVAIAIKLESIGSRQSIFFTQRRVGLDGENFTLVKFRTMNAPNGDSGNEFRSWEVGDNGRTTRIGRFLRKSHFDEIPQLWNVIKGDMAVIGPRPEMVEIADWADKQIPNFPDRLGVLPGITGWAQVKQGYCGQDPDDYREKLALDLEYAQSRSLGKDIKIIALTAKTMVLLRGWRIAKRAVKAK